MPQINVSTIASEQVGAVFSRNMIIVSFVVMFLSSCSGCGFAFASCSSCSLGKLLRNGVGRIWAFPSA